MNYEYGVVLGSPRSGTTFLMRVLNTVPEAACVSGIIFPAAMSQIVTSPSIPKDIYDALVVEFERSLTRYLDSGLFRAKAVALQKWASTRTGLMEALRGQWRPSKMIFKEPFLSLAPAYVYEALPDAPIVHIYRDGRDCANSLIATYDVLSDDKLEHLRSTEMRMGRKVDHRYVPHWVEENEEAAFLSTSPYGRAMWMWRTMVRCCDEFFSRPEVQASGRVMLLKYEDLMHDPFTYGHQVAAHLGVKPTKRFDERLKTAHPRSIGKYKRRPARELAEALTIARPELERYGYDV